MTAATATTTTTTTTAMVQPTRAYAPHSPSWQRFHEYAAPLASSSGAGVASSSGNNHPYSRQYSHVYSARLTALRGRCLANARESLLSAEEKDANVAERIIEVKEGAWSILVGTIVKETDPKRRPVVRRSATSSSANDAVHNAQSFLFPDAADGNGRKPQESLRCHLFDAEKGDVLHLEDESGRVELAPEDPADDDGERAHSLDPNGVATGVVAAVVGRVCATKGIMRVRSIHFAGPPPAEESSSEVAMRGPGLDSGATDNNDADEPVLLLVSGLGCGSDSPTDNETGASLALRREMLLEYLTDPANHSEDSPGGGGASVCRVIVAGGGVAAPAALRAEEDDKENSTTAPTKRGDYNSIAKSNKSKRASSTSAAAERVALSLRELDLYLAELLGSGIPVDYVPGAHDPTNANWPQRPMHSCLLPLSCGFVDSFGRGTNPYEGVVGGTADGNGNGGVRVLGSDGLNVADLRRFLAEKKSGANTESEEGDGDLVEAVSCLDALNQTLRYGHMAPTGPDSLPTFPSSESDPFVLQRKPAVYFVGNCEEFGTRLVDAKGDEVTGDIAGDDGRGSVTRLVCIPSFAATGEAVLVKLRSLECEVVSFNDASL